MNTTQQTQEQKYGRDPALREATGSAPNRLDDEATRCKQRKCGEFNMLRCARSAGHSGECIFVIDRSQDYPWLQPNTKFRDAGGQSTALRTDDQPHSL